MEQMEYSELLEWTEPQAVPETETEDGPVDGCEVPASEIEAGEAVPDETAPLSEPEAEESAPKKKRVSRKKADASPPEEPSPEAVEEAPDLEAPPTEKEEADHSEPVQEPTSAEAAVEPAGELPEPQLEAPAPEAPPAEDARPAASRLTKAPREGSMAKGQHSPLLSLKLNELDRGLTEEERAEWNEIYASFRAKSMLTGRIIGVDEHAFHVRNRETGKLERKRLFCAVVIPYRAKILIPETEMWAPGRERPPHVLQNMSNAEIDFVILDVDREGGVALASRRMGMAIRRHAFDLVRTGHEPGERLTCRVLAVGPSQCLVECAGRDISLRYRDISYSSFADLRMNYHPGETLNCILKEYSRAKDHLVISVKEAYPNPFEGVPARHPLGSRRQAVISGKYGGGVFCTMPDGTTCLCLYSEQHNDRDFRMGDTVILAVNKYDYARCLVYGRILAK